ncbi:DUF6036 family nucleotidyltransferase [Enterococcus hirae]
MNDLGMLKSQLQELNDKMAEQDIFATVVLIGGFAGRYLLDNYRQTLDIDFLVSSITDEADKAPKWRSLLNQLDMEEVTVVEVPPVEEIEIYDKMEFGNLTVVIPTIEYFAITKIFSDRKKDEEDLIQQKILEHCDPEKLQKMISLYKGDVLNPDNHNYNFHTLKDEFLKYGIKLN